MRYLSVCSGIEAASCAWHPLGWTAAAFSEIDRFPSAVLASRFPNVPNLGDMTRYKEWNVKPFDLLVGGTPCQAFSVAGLRNGLNDERGNLTLTFLQIAAKFQPQYVVWENVPGVLSDSTNALGLFLDGLNDLGYAVEVDILDAQHFGVPQRRRRVFVCGHNVNIGRQKRTPLFAVAVGQLLTDCLLTVLVDLFAQSSIAAPSWASQKRYSSDGLSRRMRLFGLPASKRKNSNTWNQSWESLLSDWEGAIAKFQPAQSDSVFPLRNPKGDGQSGGEGQSLARETESRSLSTLPSWKQFLVDLSLKVKSSTISTATQETIDRKIYSCAEIALSICQFICSSTNWRNHCWTPESSGLIALQELISYARSADRPLFRGMAGFCDWFGFIQSAARVERELAGYFGNGAHSREVSTERQSLRGDSPPSRSARKEVAGTLGARTSAGGGLGTDFDLAGGLQVAHTLTKRYDSSEDGCGRGVSLVTGALCSNGKAAGSATTQDAEAGLLVAFNARQDPDCWEDRTEPLDCDGTTQAIAFSCESHANAGGQLAVAFTANDYEQGTFEQADVARPLTTSADRSRAAPLVAAYSSPGDDDGYFVEAEGPESLAGDAVAYQCHGTSVGEMGTLKQGNGSTTGGVPFVAGSQENSSTTAILQRNAVRRLTPRECERLQGFPDDWTLIKYNGKQAKDGPRYKAIGNSFAVPVVRWLGERLALVEREINGNG